MKLSRSHALLLVGTIAAAGCVVENTGDDGGAGQGGDGSGATGGGGSSGSGTAGKGVAGSGGSSASGGKGGSGNAGASSTETGGSGNAGASSGAGGESGGEGGQGQAGQMPNTGGEGGAATCDDNDAIQLSCGGLDTSACDIAEFLDAECAMTWTIMKPSISNVARNCMLELTQDELCNDATNVYHCVDHALQTACPDEAVQDSCDQIVTYCPGTADTCSTYLSGLKQAGREQMVSCMEGYCDFYSCAEGLN